MLLGLLRKKIMSTKFNAENMGYKEGYPLFLGPELGIIDTVNIQYPQLEELYQEQVSQIWNEFEVDLTQDRMDMEALPKEITQLMVETISWQTVADSVASRSIIETLGKYISNSELLNLSTLWSFFEVIHARTYSHIIKQTFTDANQLIKDTYENQQVLVRSEIIVQTFDDMANLSEDASEYEIKVQIIKTLVALFALEAIAFMGSFAVTFAIAESGVFQGISQLVRLICRDEVLHTRFDHTILSILKKDPEWGFIFENHKEEFKFILDSVVEQEHVWADYLFSEGRQVVGLNAELLKNYIDYMASLVYKTITGVATEAPAGNPLPYMDRYIDSSKVQVAAQELQITSYKIGSIEDDTAGLDLDFDL